MPQLNSLYKYIASFTKRHWALEDYPLRVDARSAGDDSGPLWTAQIVGWLMTGFGDSEREAIESLRVNFEDYRARQPLPRPGTRAQVSFAESTCLDAFGEFAYDFVEEMVGVRPFFLSDQSTLSDFGDSEELQTAHANIARKYGIDSTEYEAAPLWRLLQRVRAGGV